MNEKEMLMKQLRANAFPHNNGKVMQAINIIRHSYNRLTDVQQAAQIWGVSQDDFLDCINYALHNRKHRQHQFQPVGHRALCQRKTDKQLERVFRLFHFCQIPFENISKNALMSEDRRALSLR